MMAALATIVLLKLLFALGGVAVTAYAVSIRPLSAESGEELVVFSDCGDRKDQEVETEVAGSQVENIEIKKDPASRSDNEGAVSAINHGRATPLEEAGPAVSSQPSLSELSYIQSSAARNEATKRNASAALQKAADKALAEAMRRRHGDYDEVFKRATDAQLEADKALDDFQASKKEYKIASDVFKKREKVEKAVKLDRAERPRNGTEKEKAEKTPAGPLEERRKEGREREKRKRW